MAEAPIIDIFSGLDHKDGMGGSGLDVAPSYVDGLDRRRLNFYARMRALIETVGRSFLAEDEEDPDKQNNWREYGDLAVAVERFAQAVIGDGAVLSVVGANDPLADAPDIPRAPQEPPGGLSEVEARVAAAVYEDALLVWEASAMEILERWREAVAGRPELVERQDWLRSWAERAGFLSAVYENESENVVPLGSGIYVFGWEAEAGRPWVEVYEPDVYFPDLDDSRPSEFPTTVRLVWPFVEPDPNGRPEEFVRRVTYELVRIDGNSEGLEAVDPGPAFEVGPALRYLAEGQKQTHTCLLTDEVFPAKEFKSVKGAHAGGWARVMPVPGGSPVELRRFPIGLDFIPIVHVPNTLASTTHFGRAKLARLGQLADELAASDVDEALASRWAARPPVAISGMPPGEKSIDLTPGRGIRLGDGGSITTIDMAKNLDSIGERIDRLLKRFSVNVQIPEGLLGRVDASEVPSGIAFAMSFTAFEQSVEWGRMARAAKYSLALKMVQRIAVQNDDPSLAGSTAVLPAVLEFGAYMPQDLQAVASLVQTLRAAAAISQETAIRMLTSAGVPVHDAAAELAAIRATMIDEADKLTAALEDPKYAADWLGISGYQVDDGIDPDGPVLPAPGSAV